MSKVNVIPFEEFNQRVEAGASKCEFADWHVGDKAVRVLKLDGEYFVPTKFAEDLLGWSFGST